jgi:hypothetical protein
LAKFFTIQAKIFHDFFILWPFFGAKTKKATVFPFLRRKRAIKIQKLGNIKNLTDAIVEGHKMMAWTDFWP